MNSQYPTSARLGNSIETPLRPSIHKLAIMLLISLRFRALLAESVGRHEQIGWSWPENSVHLFSGRRTHYKYAAAEGGTLGHKPMLRRAAALLLPKRLRRPEE
jgi:hypothetical protein